MPSKRIVSRFKRNETFDYTSVPKHFRSVTDGSIHRVKNYCNKTTAAKYAKAGYPPAAFEVTLQGISDEFYPLYNQLEGDYNTRRSNLEVAYSDGIAAINLLVAGFTGLLATYKNAYKVFNEASVNATGEELDESLIFDESKFSHIEKEVSKMMEDQKNA